MHTKPNLTTIASGPISHRSIFTVTDYEPSGAHTHTHTHTHTHHLGFQLLAGGKGTPRRKMAPKPKGPGGEDPKLQAALKKLQVEPVSGIEEVNMFKEDGNVLHFAAPKGEFLAQPNIGSSSASRLEHGRIPIGL